MFRNGKYMLFGRATFWFVSGITAIRVSPMFVRHSGL